MRKRAVRIARIKLAAAGALAVVLALKGRPETTGGHRPGVVLDGPATGPVGTGAQDSLRRPRNHIGPKRLLLFRAGIEVADLVAETVAQPHDHIAVGQNLDIGQHGLWVGGEGVGDAGDVGESVASGKFVINQPLKAVLPRPPIGDRSPDAPCGTHPDNRGKYRRNRAGNSAETPAPARRSMSWRRHRTHRP